VGKSEQDLIRRYIGALDIFATNRTNHTHFSERWNTGQPGMAFALGDIRIEGVTHRIDPDAFVAMNRQFHETAAQLNKDLAGYAPAMAELAQRYGVPGGAFALLNPYNADSREDARKAAKVLADEICARDAGGAGKLAEPEMAVKPEAVPLGTGMATPAELAREWGTKPEATRKSLSRWRKNNAGGDGYIQNPDRRPNEPGFLYDRAKVRPVMDGLKQRQDRKAIRRTKTSGQRPAKQI